MPLPGPSPAIHAALCSSSSPLFPLSCEGSLPPLLWWQVPSEVFNHLSCKTPFNWNYPLADKLLEPYHGLDIVVRVFQAARFCSFCSVSNSLPPFHLQSVSFFLNGWSFIPVYFCLLLTLSSSYCCSSTISPFESCPVKHRFYLFGDSHAVAAL